jgi:hypothetical protein
VRDDVAVVIARLWHGWTTDEHADAYQALVTGEILPRIEGLIGSGGFRGAYVFRRDASDGAEFTTLLLFDSIDAVKEFAGEDYERAYVPAEARRLLSRYDEQAAHYETVLDPDRGV